jgi:hypothetical protein
MILKIIHDYIRTGLGYLNESPQMQMSYGSTKQIIKKIEMKIEINDKLS